MGKFVFIILNLVQCENGVNFVKIFADNKIHSFKLIKNFLKNGLILFLIISAPLYTLKFF